jgi:hypothetical protein
MFLEKTSVLKELICSWHNAKPLFIMKEGAYRLSGKIYKNSMFE